MVTSVWMRTSSMRRRRSSSASCCASCSSSFTCSDMDGFEHLLGVDLLHALPGFVLRDLPLGGGRGRHGQERGDAELLGHRHRPLYELLDPRARRQNVARAQVDQLAGKAVANCAPEVLLDEPVWMVGQLLA